MWCIYKFQNNQRVLKGMSWKKLSPCTHQFTRMTYDVPDLSPVCVIGTAALAFSVITRNEFACLSISSILFPLGPCGNEAFIVTELCVTLLSHIEVDPNVFIRTLRLQGPTVLPLTERTLNEYNVFLVKPVNTAFLPVTLLGAPPFISTSYAVAPGTACHSSVMLVSAWFVG